ASLGSAPRRWSRRGSSSSTSPRSSRGPAPGASRSLVSARAAPEGSPPTHHPGPGSGGQSRSACPFPGDSHIGAAPAPAGHCCMQNDVVAATVKGVMPTPNGCAIFLGNEEKTFVIYVDHSVGNAIQMTLDGVKKDRPLTHDLIGSILLGLGTRLERVVINDARDKTFFARIFLTMENELGTKIVEIDARPSDSIVLALQQKRPIYVARAVFDAVEDMTEILEQVRKQQAEEEQGEEPL